jgi:hypothetical protein
LSRAYTAIPRSACGLVDSPGYVGHDYGGFRREEQWWSVKFLVRVSRPRRSRVSSWPYDTGVPIGGKTSFILFLVMLPSFSASLSYRCWLWCHFGYSSAGHHRECGAAPPRAVVRWERKRWVVDFQEDGCD